MVRPPEVAMTRGLALSLRREWRVAEGRGQPLLPPRGPRFIPAMSARPRSPRERCQSGWPPGRPSAARGRWSAVNPGRGGPTRRRMTGIAISTRSSSGLWSGPWIGRIRRFVATWRKGSWDRNGPGSSPTAGSGSRVGETHRFREVGGGMVGSHPPYACYGLLRVISKIFARS